MPLSKAKMRERKRSDRLGLTNGDLGLTGLAIDSNVKPNKDNVKPRPAHYLDPVLDPNPLLRPPEAHLPNCPDGRYREHFTPAPKPVRKRRA